MPPLDTGKILPVLNYDEQARLTELEESIQLGLSTFILVGTALAEIRDAKLYAPNYEDFPAYLEARWGIKRRRGNQLIESALAVQGFLDPPDLEAHARALLALPPEAREPVYKLAQRLTEGTTTAATVEALVGADLDSVLAMAEAEPEFLDMAAQLLREAGNGKPSASVVRSLAAVYHGIADSGTVDGPDGTSLAWLELSPEQRRAYLMENLDHETFERQQQRLAQRERTGGEGGVSTDRIYVPKAQWEHLRSVAALAPRKYLSDYEQRWGDKLA